MARITIVGLGIIGASLGLALKRAKLQDVEIVGHDRSYDAAVAARRAGAVDKMDASLVRAVGDAGLVILCTPVLSMREILTDMSDHLAAGCVVTDTGSTKQQIVAWTEEILPKTVRFVGGHPMTGKDTAGVSGPDARLFDGRIYCLTPTNSTDEAAVQSVHALVQALGATPLFVDPAEHDALVAPVSHLPLIISVALMNLASRSSGWRDISKLAAGGFRHVVVNAGNSPAMSRDLCVTNAANLSTWIDLYIKELQRCQRAIAAGPEEILRVLQSAFDAHGTYTAGPAPEEAPASLPTLGQSFQQLFLGQRPSRSHGKKSMSDR